MAGVVIETVSNRKLIALGLILLLFQVAFFLLGGLIAPSPTNVQNILGTKCLDLNPKLSKDKFFYSRGKNSCDSIPDFDDSRVEELHISADRIVFAFQFPQYRDGEQLDMSRWFQNIIGVITFETAYSKERKDTMPADDSILELHASLGYRNEKDDDDDWKVLANSTELRKLDCTIDEDQLDDGKHYNCSVLSMFELGSCHHDFYLLNIRLPPDHSRFVNIKIGDLKDLWFVAIAQNGGFTKVWFGIKSFVFPLVLPILIWYWRRVKLANRPANLLEKMLLALGSALTLLNFPVEWLTLWVDMPFMLLLTDIRQGIFYSILMSFWIVFAGEHTMDDCERNRLVAYWKHLGAVGFGCICMFIFEMCERGVHLYNPFYSIWATPTSTNLAYTFISLAAISAGAYFCFLLYMIVKVFRNISSKKSALPNMGSARKKFYMGLIFRFNFLMVVTLLCAALTVCFFIVSEVSESEWKLTEEGQKSLNYTSAFLTGVYGMWNLYVFSLLILYAPSTKYMTLPDSTSTLEDDNDETVELSRMPSEMSQLAQFASKAAAD